MATTLRISDNEQLVTSDTSMSSEEHEFVVLDRKDVQDFNEDSLLPLSDEDLKTVTAWLQPTDYSADSSEYNKHLKSHLSGTCGWIQESPNYTEWHDGSEKGCLWIKAVAGAGKSVAAASLASRLAVQETVPVLFFFFRQIITANQRPQSLLRDYLSQLLSYSPPLQHKLKKWIDDRRSLDTVSFVELWKTFQSALVLLPRVYCVVDALDEMDDGHEDFLNDLVALGQIKPAAIKVLLTSRPLPRVEESLRDRSVLPIMLQGTLVEPDILVYIKHRLASYDIPEHTKEITQETINTKSKGLFLYARLVIDDVLDPLGSRLTDEESVQMALARMPNTLSEMYARMLLEHSIRSGVSQELQIKILRWVTRSERPLRVLELANMISFSRFFPPRDTKAVVRQGCGPLLEILEDETVCVIHHSLTEFLYDQERHYNADVENAGFPLLDDSSTQRAIALTCIAFLTKSGWHRDFTIPNGSSNTGFEWGCAKRQMKLKHPFLAYAASNWHRHVRKIGNLEEELLAALDDLMLSDTVFEAWTAFENIKTARLHNARSKQNNEQDKLTPIHAAAATGISNYLVHLIKIGKDLNEAGYRSRTPLFRAAENGHEEVVEILIAHGAEKNRDDDVGLKPLIVAAMANHHKVVSVLLRAGVDPFTPKTKEWPGRRCGNSATTKGDTAVEYACHYGHVEAVQAFMPHLTIDGLHTALYWATRFGSSKVVQALTESPDIDVNRITRDQTPLFLAAAARDIDSMRLLLIKDADAQIPSNNVFEHGGVSHSSWEAHRREFSPLHAWAQACSNTYTLSNASKNEGEVASMKSGFHLLIDAGCDVNAVDATGKTPLVYIVSPSDYEYSMNHWRGTIVRFLLELGASATIELENGSNLLHVYNGKDTEIIRLLVQYGAGINSTRSSDGKTPLMTSKNCLLLDHGADCNLADPDGNTMLHYMAQDFTFNKEVLKRVLSAGADLMVPNLDGNTPLHFLTQHLDDELVRLCLDNGGNLEHRNHRGQTILLALLSSQNSNGKFQKLQSLVEAGADLHTIDHEGKTALHMVFHTLNQSLADLKGTLKYMLKNGIDHKRTDHAGNNLFHEIAKTWRVSNKVEQLKIAGLLEMLNISPTARNNRGELPLHVICQACRDCSGDVLTYFLSPECRQEINAADNDGIRPIHIAATYSEELVARLIACGADTTLLTNEGQTPLMVASRARQSNIVGMLVDNLQEAGKSRFIHYVDRKGDSALHHACRAGRHESVRILLEVGADPNLRNKRSETLLYACSEFPVENAFWETSEPVKGAYIQPQAAFVLSNDDKRPQSERESISVGVRGSIRLLIEYGVEVTFLVVPNSRSYLSGPKFSHPDPLANAIRTGCQPMIDELLSGPYLQDMVKDTIKQGGDSLEAFSYLVKREQENVIREFERSGTDLLKVDGSGKNLMTEIVKIGNVSLLNAFGSYARAMDSEWVQTTEKTNANLVGRLQPLLHVACSRTLPNLDIIEVLVERLGVGVNEVSTVKRSYQPEEVTPLHRLATGTHWWYQRAVEYLIKNGANLEAMDPQGATPLLTACKKVWNSGHARLPILRALLRAGADPNVTDRDGLTALNLAIGDIEVVKELLQGGADPNHGKKPFIFNAIQTMNLEIVRVLVESGADCNIQPLPSVVEDQEKPVKEGGRNCLQQLLNQIENDSSYPLEWAARIRVTSRDDELTVISIIEALLTGGANPFLLSHNGNTVLQNIATSGVILKPFMKLPGLPLEARDTSGRTILLAVCTNKVRCFNDNTPIETTVDRLSLLLSRGASLQVSDNEGRNPLHLIIIHSSGRDQVVQNIQFIISQPDGPSLLAKPDSQGRTPLHHALRSKINSLVTVEELLKHGADITEPDPVDGSTALHYITPDVSIRWPDARRLYFESLLAKGVDINARDHLGNTAIFRFVASGAVTARYEDTWLKQPKILVASTQIFADAGADLTVRNKRGESLLHCLAGVVLTEISLPVSTKKSQEDRLELFSWLRDQGCDVSWEDCEQRTALDVAAAAGNEWILKLFQRE